MNPINYIKSLLPSFTRVTALEDCRMRRLEITTVTHPAYEAALRLFNNRTFQYPELRSDFEVFKRHVRGPSAPNTVVAVERTFKNIVSILDALEEVINSNYGEDIAGAGMTYYKSAVLQLLESVNFATKYARRYLNYVLVVETSYIEDPQGEALANDLGAAIVPADVRYLRDNFLQFCTVMVNLTKPANVIEAQLKQIPDVTITDENAKTLPHTAGDSRIDPFSHGIIPVAMNPIYHIRMRVAEWQVDRLNNAKEEKKLLELRRLKMERSLAGKKDASLDKQIDYIQGRIENLDAEIRRKEQEYA
jgi:hypothetical protein